MLPIRPFKTNFPGMIFNSIVFVVFFISLHLLYWKAPKRFGNAILLLGSVIFYGYWSILFLFHFLGTILINYLLYIWASKHPGRLSLSITVILNLINLAFFKYTYFLLNFFVDLGISGDAGKQLLLDSKSIVLPLAISFYTFQILALQIDSQREKFSEKISLEKFSLFILFFPQLIAGPIMRHGDFFDQLDRNRRYSGLSFNSGYILIIVGVIKKVLIADSISGLIDPVFSNPSEYDSVSLIASVYGFAIQIYCDFAGYTDMARGMALLLGFDIPPNFNAPYFSLTFKEFWTRWHITLSTWLRDYLYISLGGNRQGKLRTFINLFLTMLLGGLWHGANYTFIIWGFLHGSYLVIERLLGLESPSRERSKFLKIISALIVFHAVCFAWIFFRADSASLSFSMISGIFANSGKIRLLDVGPLLLLVILGLLTQLYEYLPKESKSISFRYRELVVPVFALIIAFLTASVSSQASPFIYFQF
ncbi:putative alginate O-acetyltransferase AlgI [Leptospira licerasiae serovar Varillal str. VAR 010]|uniref:Alginate O-acetyltransferase AlgI n=2 Tax=Leptospira licerasiae TaxID=447106 RepID=A0ABN0H6E5_9LEPT|nr:putative alginate O-acetyltransferase AlgI [Leptospira licerasiae serovar Varillal str. VAR 010]EJZ41121.1 putative alginate O-acetyltransferase AlgI [Leptospira licerasiae str. MMD4847]